MDMIRKVNRFRLSAPIAILAVIFIALFGCDRGNKVDQSTAVDSVKIETARPAKRPMVILYSYSPIGLELKQMVQILSDTIWAGREVSYGSGPGPIVLANSGVGIANAAATTQYLIDRYNPAGIVFCGIASAVNPAHHIGDLVIPDRYITFDYGYWGEQGLLTDSVTVGRLDSAGFRRMLDIPVDVDLFNRLGSAANDAAYLLRGIGMRLPEIHQGGIGISGNSFLDNKAKREHLYKTLRAQITDTESSAVVQTAYARGIPVVVLRTCAAPVGESTTKQAQEELADFFKVAAYNVALTLREFLTPQIE